MRCCVYYSATTTTVAICTSAAIKTTAAAIIMVHNKHLAHRTRAAQQTPYSDAEERQEANK